MRPSRRSVGAWPGAIPKTARLRAVWLTEYVRSAPAGASGTSWVCPPAAERPTALRLELCRCLMRSVTPPAISTPSFTARLLEGLARVPPPCVDQSRTAAGRMPASSVSCRAVDHWRRLERLPIAYQVLLEPGEGADAVEHQLAVRRGVEVLLEAAIRRLPAPRLRRGSVKSPWQRPAAALIGGSVRLDVAQSQVYQGRSLQSWKVLCPFQPIRSRWKRWATR